MQTFMKFLIRSIVMTILIIAKTGEYDHIYLGNHNDEPLNGK